jgi:hypothetical protein
MRAYANGNTGADLAAQSLRASGNSTETRFPITVGVDYSVFSIATLRWGLDLLLLDDMGRPSWFPSELFTITADSFPPAWELGRFEGLSVLAILGYPTAARNLGHHDDLIDRRLKALEIFLAECDRGDLTERDIEKLVALEAIVASSL